MNYLWLVLLILHSALSQTTDKYSDEDRPYKFGFNIQGYQHRQEEKDERGLIKGEYGFITADGYYRVTVYATDENGDFKILSMKNYYVGFPPEDPTTTPGTTSDRAARPRQQQLNPSVGRAPVARGRALGGDDGTTKAPKAFTRPQGVAACSDCSIPTTTPKGNAANLLVDTGEFRSGRTRGGNFAPVTGQGPGGQSPQASPRGRVQTPGGKFSGFSQGSNTQGPAGEQAPQLAGRAPLSNSQFSGGIGNDARGSFEGGNPPQSGGSPRFKSVGGSPGFKPTGGSFGSRDSGSPGSSRGRTDFTQNNQLDGTPQRRPQVGEVREGLPPGVTLNDIKDLLYTFNYTVGFHGHHEDGYRNGDKQGDYFFDGRDGVERKVEYLANEFGFQPNITLIDLADNDVRKPKEETEKEYGLKGYEFKWFYRK